MVPVGPLSPNVDVAKDQYSLAKGERHPSRRNGVFWIFDDFCIFLFNVSHLCQALTDTRNIQKCLRQFSMMSSEANLEGAVVRLHNLKTKASIVLSWQLRQLFTVPGYTTLNDFK